MRKKRREKGGHKDPLLQEISRLQEEVVAQISSLRREHLEAEKKRTEIDAVALILGLSPSDRPRKASQSSGQQEEKARPPDRKRETPRSPERHQQKARYRGRSSNGGPGLGLGVWSVRLGLVCRGLSWSLFRNFRKFVKLVMPRYGDPELGWPAVKQPGDSVKALEQGCPNYGPRANCSPAPTHLRWPTACLYKHLFFIDQTSCIFSPCDGSTFVDKIPS